jgi:hypothetical protein
LQLFEFWLTAVSSASLMPSSCARSRCMLAARGGCGLSSPRDVCGEVSRSAGTGVPSTSRLNRRWSIVLLHYPALIGLYSYCRPVSASRREARRAGATAARTPRLVAGCLRDLNQNSLLARGRAPSRRGTPCRDGALPSPGAIHRVDTGRADGVLAAPWDARGRYEAQSRGGQWWHRHLVAYTYDSAEPLTALELHLAV